jgi:hypothetical protein
MSQVQERSHYPEEDLEDGWQKRQERQKNGTHNRSLSMLWKIIQVRPEQEKNIDAKNKNPPLFLFSTTSIVMSH